MLWYTRPSTFYSYMYNVYIFISMSKMMYTHNNIIQGFIQDFLVGEEVFGAVCGGVCEHAAHTR